MVTTTSGFSVFKTIQVGNLLLVLLIVGFFSSPCTCIGLKELFDKQKYMQNKDGQSSHNLYSGQNPGQNQGQNQGQHQGQNQGQNQGQHSFVTESTVKPYVPSTLPKFCVKPNFWQFCSQNPELSRASIASKMEFQFSKMPFKEDRWLHVDVYNKPGIKDPIEMREVAIAISNLQGQIIGQFAEYIPCLNDHPVVPTIKELFQLYDKDPTANLPTVVYECPMEHTRYGMEASNLNVGKPPTQAIIGFKDPVLAFYFHYKFTDEEWATIQLPKNDSSSSSKGTKPIKLGFQVIMMIQDDGAHCHTHFLSKSLGLTERDEKMMKSYKMSALVDCHIAGGVSPISGPKNQSDSKNQFTLTDTKDHKFSEDIEFDSTSPHPRVRKPQNIPQLSDVGDKSQKKQIEDYNDKNYNSNVTTVKPLNLVVAHPRKRKTTVPHKRTGVDSNHKSKKVISDNPRQELYLECFHTRGCMGEPSGCIPSKSCQSIVSYIMEDEFVRFEILASSLKYVALGISRDRQMGDDSVVECVRESGDDVHVYTSWNLAISQKRNTRSKTHDTILNPYGKYDNSDAVIYCTFLMKKDTTIRGERFDLENEKFYLFSVTGSQAIDGPNGNVEQHDRFLISQEKELLYVIVGKSPTALVIEMLHGVSMIIIWIFVVPLATFITRYFKETFLKTAVRKYSFWYGIHLVAMCLTIVVTFGTVILICIFDKTWPGMNGWTFHSTIGLVMLCFMLLQIPLALGIIRYNRTHKHLLINFIHGFNGHCLFFLGFTTIYKSRNMRDGLPCSADSPLIGWIVTYLIIHLCMSYQVCYSDFVQGRHVSRTYTLGPLEVPERMEDGKEEPGALGRKIFLTLFIFFSIVFTITLSIQYLTGAMMDCAEEEVINKI